MLKVALFGGTFNPVHWGHLRVAKALQCHVDFDHFYFVPCKVPVLDKTTQVSALERLYMLELALKSYPQFEVSDCEILRETPSYTYETLQFFRERFGAQASLSFVIGMDSFLQLPRWHAWERLLTQAHCIVLARPNIEMGLSKELDDFLKQHEVSDVQHLLERPSGGIYRYQAGCYPISSSEIRTKIIKGEQVRGLLPYQVRRYIEYHSLYIGK